LFNNFKISAKLLSLIAIFFIGFILFGSVAYQTISTIKINGKMYNEIVLGKDLVADILPPPEYIIESYLTALQLSKETDKTKIEELIAYESTLKKDFDTRHQVWVRELPKGDMKKIMIEDSYKPAIEFFDIFEKEFIPAIKDGDKGKADEILIKLDKSYSEHRTNINKVVSLANISNTTIEGTAKNTINKDLLLLISLAICVLGIVIVFGIVIIRRITGPLYFLTNHLKTVATGDFSIIISDKYLQSQDELGDIARATSTMQGSLRTIISVVKKSSFEVEVLSEDMAQDSKANGKSSQQISVATNIMAEGASTQSGQVESIKELIQESVKETEKGYNMANEMLHTARFSSEVAINGRDKIVEVIKQYEWISKTVAFATESIQNLGKRSGEIGEFIHVITGIASQTNLLSLNASIEAARAGEDGKGFSIVAQQIKKLSVDSAQAAKIIGDLISDTQIETLITVKSMESNLEKVNTQLLSIKSGGEALETIVEKVKETETSASHIYDIYKHIQEMTENINISINDIASVICDNAAYSEEVAASSEEQCESTEKIVSTTVELASMAQKLQKEISKFKYDAY